MGPRLRINIHKDYIHKAFKEPYKLVFQQPSLFKSSHEPFTLNVIIPFQFESFLNFKRWFIQLQDFFNDG